MLYRRNKIWWIRYQFKGKPYSRSLQTADKAEAEKLAMEVKRRLKAAGQGLRAKPIDIPAPIVTVESCLAAFYRSREGRSPQTIDWYRDRLKAFAAKWGPYPVNGITVAEVETFISGKRKEISEQYVASLFRALRAFFRFCQKRGLIQSCPTDSLTPPKAKSLRPRKWIDREMLDKLERAVQGTPFRELFLLCRYAGLRLTEAACLQWADGDSVKRLIYVERGKGEKARVIPMHQKLVGLWQEADRGAILTKWKDITSWSKEFNRFTREKGFDIQVHDLRHAFASQLVDRGVELAKIQKWLGHSSPLTTAAIYVHLKPFNGEVDKA